MCRNLPVRAVWLFGRGIEEDERETTRKDKYHMVR
jgi:hypothetical protein